MAIKDLKKIVSSDRELSKFQDNIDQFSRQLNATITDGVLLKEMSDISGKKVPIVLGPTTTKIPHGLTRAYQGWQIVDMTSDARVWRDDALDYTKEENSKSKFLALKASATVTVQLWVF